jgi:hypothetical protein
VSGPEGTVFDIIKGRYSDQANFDVLLKGHTGEGLCTDRVSRGNGTIDAAYLSCAIAVQPHVIKGLADDVSLPGRGLLARWLYAMPASLVGRRDVAPPALTEEAREAYRKLMRAVWGTTNKVTLTFSPEANEVMKGFEKWLEPNLHPDGVMSPLCGWPNKLAGAIARISGILHQVSNPERQDTEIDAETVESAVRIGKDYLLPHAFAAFGIMSADERIGDLKRVLAATRANPSFKNRDGHQMNLVNLMNGAGLLKRHDVHARVLGSRHTTEYVQSVMVLGVERGYFRYHLAGKASNGRANVVFEVHPDFYKARDSS